MFITFEGIDGAGKSTQISLVEDYLQKQGNDVLLIREPGGNEVSEKIREILLSSKNEISPVAELLLFEAARAQLTAKVIKPAIAEGKVVICDRFYDSTTAYQGYGRGLDMDMVIKSNMTATGGLKPDLTFYLDLPLNIAKERSGRREKDRMEKSGDDFFIKVANGFREIAMKEPGRVVRIDASNSIENTFKLIIKHLEKK